MRQKKLILNTSMSLILQLVTIICGFILPKMIMTTYGSNVNGMISSIAQFLSVITFLEFGIGAVIQASLYKPLANHDNKTISEILSSGSKFFRKIATILFIYVVFLTVFYPLLIDKDYKWIYSASLILIMSVSTFVQYYFGIIDGLLLFADQRGYIQYFILILTLILNTIVCVILMLCGASIHLVKGVTALIYLLRPFFLRKYINKYYTINRKISYKKEPLVQKWNGTMQHIAYMILNSTDIVVLTLFSTLANVSVYSAYNLVIAGLKQLFVSLDSGFRPLIGELWVRQNTLELNRIFGYMEWFFHTVTIFVFGCTSVLMIPFVTVYTNGITDADYIQPMFSIILTIAYMANTLSSPYWIMILAAGHFKETQWKFLLSALLNITVSVLAVYHWGLIGVAVGTLIAMIYQDIWMIHYVSNHLNHWPLRYVIKQFLIDFISLGIGILCSHSLKLSNNSYISWFVMAIKTASIWAVAIIAINILFCYNKVVWILKQLKKYLYKN